MVSTSTDKSKINPLHEDGICQHMLDNEDNIIINEAKNTKISPNSAVETGLTTLDWSRETTQQNLPQSMDAMLLGDCH